MNLVEQLMKDLGVTREQAEGGAGLLLGFAQDRLDREPFVEIADTIPAISDIIGKAPRCDIPKPRPLRAMISRWLGGLGELSVLAKPFDMLGIDKPMIGNFVGVLLKFFGERGGARVESILRSVFR